LRGSIAALSAASVRRTSIERLIAYSIAWRDQAPRMTATYAKPTTMATNGIYATPELVRSVDHRVFGSIGIDRLAMIAVGRRDIATTAERLKVEREIPINRHPSAMLSPWGPQ